MDIIAIGEPLLEFSAIGHEALDSAGQFASGFGGDTSNFLVAAARSGARTHPRVSDGKFKPRLDFYHSGGLEGQAPRPPAVGTPNNKNKAPLVLLRPNHSRVAAIT